MNKSLHTSSCCHSEEVSELTSTQGVKQAKPPACHTPSQHPDYLFWGSALLVSGLFILHLFFNTWLAGYGWLQTMATTAYDILHEIWWGVVIGALFIGVLSKVPRQFVISLLGKGGSFSGLLRAVGAGVLLDLCSHGILMVAAKLYERGASAGQVIAFLLASPWNSFTLTLVLVSLIGWFWTLTFIILSMVIGIITGWMFDALVQHKVLPANPNATIIDDDFRFWQQAKKHFQQTSFDGAFFKQVLRSGIVESKMVVRWLLFGILLAGLMRVIFSPEQFTQYFGPTFLGLSLTVLLATVLEVCSEGSAPIATDIMNRAGAPGNGFAFLMAGVATDYTEVMVLKDTTKSLKLALFLPLISVPQVILIAWLINTFQ